MRVVAGTPKRVIHLLCCTPAHGHDHSWQIPACTGVCVFERVRGGAVVPKQTSIDAAACSESALAHGPDHIAPFFGLAAPSGNQQESEKAESLNGD